MTHEQHWKYFEAISRFALDRAPSNYVADIRAGLQASDVVRAVTRRDTAQLYNWLIGVVQMQGIADASAAKFVARNGIVGWHDIRSPTHKRVAACADR